MTKLILVHSKSRKPVERGEVVTDFRGDTATVTGWDEPRHPGSTGRVYVKPADADWTHGYYPSVYDLEWSTPA